MRGWRKRRLNWRAWRLLAGTWLSQEGNSNASGAMWTNIYPHIGHISCRSRPRGLAQQRSFQVRLGLLNEGTAPADDVDETITYPELILASRSVELDDIWDLRKMEPMAPQGPRD